MVQNFQEIGGFLRERRENNTKVALDSTTRVGAYCNCNEGPLLCKLVAAMQGILTYKISTNFILIAKAAQACSYSSHFIRETTKL